MTNFCKVTVGLILICLFAQCKQVYDPHVEAKTTGLLVVEGFLHSGQGPTTLRLSRSSDLEHTTLIPEFSAQVNVEGDDGSSFAFVDGGNGEYSIAQLSPNNGVQYRV